MGLVRDDDNQPNRERAIHIRAYNKPGTPPQQTPTCPCGNRQMSAMVAQIEEFRGYHKEKQSDNDQDRI